MGSGLEARSRLALASGGGSAKGSIASSQPPPLPPPPPPSWPPPPPPCIQARAASDVGSAGPTVAAPAALSGTFGAAVGGSQKVSAWCE